MDNELTMFAKKYKSNQQEIATEITTIIKETMTLIT